MDEGIKRHKLTIRNALLQFCFEDRIEDVRMYEKHFTSQELAEFGCPNLGGTSNRGERKHPDVRQMEFRNRLVAAWEGLLLDFRARLERGEIVVTGVETHPKPTTERTVIPGQWATDFKIDALKNTIGFRQTRYLAILVGEPECFDKGATLEPKPNAAEPTSGRLPKITPENVRDLTDEVILRLLEEHAERVIRSPDGMLIAPGKVTFLPIVRGKMRQRANAGELLPTLTAESQWLSKWIAGKVTLHGVPTASTIGRVLGSEYSLLKSRSKPAT